MASVSTTPTSTWIVPLGRALARGLCSLLPIAVALAITALWFRPSADRQPVAVAAPPSPFEQERQTAEAIERARASTVALEYGVGDVGGRRRVATGVVVSDRGDVLSVRVDPPEGRDRESILVRDASGHRHNARWMASDPETGLSLLKVESEENRPICPIRPATRAAILGAAVFVIGNPYGLVHSVGRGYVSGLDRRLEIAPRPLGGLIQVQAPLHPGDSGALLADMEGGWLGLIRGDSKDSDDLGFAIPAGDAMWVADQLLAHRKVERAFLGIKLAPESKGRGAVVDSVVKGSPAEQAKLQPGDRVVRLDGQPILGPDDLLDRLDRTPAGAEVALEFVRDEATLVLTIRTAARPPGKPAEPAPSPSPVKPAPAPAPAASRELLDRIERVEKQLDEIRRREAATEAP